MNGSVADLESVLSGAANASGGSAEVAGSDGVDVAPETARTPLVPFVDTLQDASANGRQSDRPVETTADVHAADCGVAGGLKTTTDIRVRWHNHE